MANQDNIVTKLKARLAEERDPFWARKAAFAVAMRLALHDGSNALIKNVALTLLAGEIINDMEERYGKDFDVKTFTYNCEQFSDALMDSFNG